MADTTTPTWRLVPGEPTPEMEQAAADYLDAFVKAYGLWGAMLEAAPAPQDLPPVQLPEPVGWRVEYGAVSLPVGDPARLTCSELYETEAEADEARANLEFDNVAQPLYTADQLRDAIAADRRAGGR